MGGLCLKLLPSLIGIPDRLCLLPGGVVFFVELKAPGQKPRPIQVKRIAQLRRLGFRVEVVDSKERVDEMIQALGGDG